VVQKFALFSAFFLSSLLNAQKITLKFQESERLKLPGQQKQARFLVSGLDAGNTVLLMNSANCNGDKIATVTSSSESVEINVTKDKFEYENHHYYLSAKVLETNACSDAKSFFVKSKALLIDIIDTNERSTSVPPVLPRFISIEEIAEPNLPYAPSFKVSGLNVGDEINLYKSKESETCTGTIIANAKATSSEVIFKSPNLQPGGEFYVSAGLKIANPRSCSKAITLNIPVIDYPPLPPKNDALLELQLQRTDKSNSPSFKVKGITKDSTIFLFKSTHNEACKGSPIASQESNNTNRRNFIFEKPTTVNKGTISYFSAQIKDDPKSCSNIIDYTPIGPSVSLFINNATKTSNELAPLFYIRDLAPGYYVELFKDNPCTRTFFEKLMSTGDSIYANINVSYGEHTYYARGIDDEGTPGPCSAGVKYKLDRYAALPALSIVDGKTKGSNRRPVFKVSAALKKNDTLELYKTSNCFNEIIGTVKVKSDSSSLNIQLEERSPLQEDKTYTFSAKLSDEANNSRCSNNVTYSLDTTGPQPLIKLKGDVEDKNPKPTFVVSNVSPGDKVTLYLDYECKNKISAETIVPANKSSLEITSSTLLTESSYVFYANALDSNGIVGTCSQKGANYTYKKAGETTGGRTTGGGTTGGVVDPKDPIEIENERVKKKDVHDIPVIELHPTQIGVGDIENQIRRPNLIRKRDCDNELDAYLLEDHVVPYVVNPDGRKYLFDGHHTSKILSEINGAKATTKGRLIRDYRNIDFTYEEFKNDMIRRGWVWLHDVRKEQAVGNQYNPDQLFKASFEEVDSVSDVTQLTPDPFRDIAYIIKYGINPRNAFVIDYTKKKRRFDGYKINKVSRYYAFIPPSLPATRDSNYTTKILTSDAGLFDGHKWGLYIRYRLQRDFGVTFQDLAEKTPRNNMRTYSGCRKFGPIEGYIPFDEKIIVDDFFMLNICRAHRIARDDETKEIFSQHPNWLPGFVGLKSARNKTGTEVPTWCANYTD
jgi:hypothetical protein